MRSPWYLLHLLVTAGRSIHRGAIVQTKCRINDLAGRSTGMNVLDTVHIIAHFFASDKEAITISTEYPETQRTISFKIN